MRLTTVKGLVESPKGEWDMNKKYKKSLAALLLCGIFLLIGCQEDVNKDDIAEDTIRFMTFNMRQTAGIDPVKQGEWVASFEPDIVATQEVDKNTRRSDYDVTALFQEGGKFKHAFLSKQMPFQGGEYGLAMFSNYEILEKETIPIYSDEWIGEEVLREEQKRLFDTMNPENPQTLTAYNEFCERLKVNGKCGIEPNVIQKIIIEVNGKKVSVYGVHLSYEMVIIREKQREQLAQLLKDDKNKYQVVIGDFNSDQGTAEMNYFVENYNLANGKDGIWHDTFPVGESTEMLSYAIDNIVTTKNIKISNVHYEKTDLSDHTMLYADITLK